MRTGIVIPMNFHQYSSMLCYCLIMCAVGFVFAMHVCSLIKMVIRNSSHVAVPARAPCVYHQLTLMNGFAVGFFTHVSPDIINTMVIHHYHCRI